MYLYGARTVRSTPAFPNTDFEFDGLILGGGRDIHPSRYGDESVIDTIHDEARDQIEWEMITRAVKENKPILGICRGLQMLNIYFGGTLHQEVGRVFDDFFPTKSTIGKIVARHKVTIESGSRLFNAVKKNELRVNSLHHQAAREVGENLHVTARLENGMVQALEHTELPWIVGVQWHPELMLMNAPQRRIFKKFLQYCPNRV